MIRRLFVAALPLLGLALLLPVTAADDKKDEKKTEKKEEKKPDGPDKKEEKKAEKKEDKKKETVKLDPKDKRDSKEKLLTSGKPFAGKLVIVEGAQKYLTVEVVVPEIDPGKVQGHANWRGQRLLEISRVADPRDRAAQLAQMQIESQQRSQDIYRQGRHRLELQAADDMKVRMLFPPVEYDEKGRPKKYTKKELDDLKGPDKKLPGYPAEFDNLKPEQTVEVYLAKTKTAPRPKGKDKDATGETPRPQVVMIVIQFEPQK